MALAKRGRFNGAVQPKVLSYSWELQGELIRKQVKNKLNIGMIDTWGRRHILVDDNRAEMIEDLKFQMEHPELIDWIKVAPWKRGPMPTEPGVLTGHMRKRIEEAIAELETRPMWEEAAVMNDLEAEIDAFAKGEVKPGRKENLAHTVFTDNNTCKVWPASFNWFGGYSGECRIPTYLQGENLPVLARTRMCKALEECYGMLAELEDDVLIDRYEKMRPLPVSLLTRPTHPSAALIAFKFDKRWREIWVESHEGRNVSDADRGKLYTELSLEFGIKLLSWPQWFQFDVVCELAKILYPGYFGIESVPVYPEGHPMAGRPKKHTDGLLWTPAFGKVFIDLLVSEGEAFKYVPIALYKDYVSLREERHLTIVVENGVVRRHEDNAIIGTCLPLADGEYDMQLGTVWKPKLAAPVMATMEEDAPEDVLAMLEREAAAASEEGCESPDTDPRYRIERMLLRYGFYCEFERKRIRYWSFAEKGKLLNEDGEDAYFAVRRGEALYVPSNDDTVDPVGFREPEELAAFLESTFGLKPRLAKPPIAFKL